MFLRKWYKILAMNTKVIIGIIVATAIVLVGAVVLLGNSTPGSSKAVLGKTAGAKIEAPETNFDFKDIPYPGGNAIHEFKVKNTGDKELVIANLATSCMCTKVYLQTESGKGPEFGMKGHTASSDWTGAIAPGKEGQVVAVYDPTAHGPQGVGPISRIVSFETNDPGRPYMEFTFSGNVVK
ncbi:MAG: hypothetical protein UV33_C0001G0028 [Candidatus Daviesbacteria bacterium GW2011_GWA1_42_6]|uniref:PF07610 family protein n=2 Tax=Candidatus Daviesiibacteriota TaxID=1752718 RepID=A0A0G1AWN8_9BACT|nr:MAG: hypothetical protein UV33_C0001G0028 [Candidatus Daviesbacteria bacterium GW2011_GWA1_42_6]